MKRFTLNLIGAGILGLGLAIAPSALAQVDTAPTVESPAPGLDTTEPYEAGDRDFDWGWLGLLGLLGLAGLTRRPEERVTYREPDVTTRSSYRE